MQRPFALSIAGFDPSGGAGVLADCKTFESHKVYGLGVVTAVTYQNEETFDGLDWVNMPSVFHQIKVVAEKHPLKVVKIGLIESMEAMLQLVEFLHTLCPGVKIIWDPVLAASAGFTFHQEVNLQKFEAICNLIFLVTPNRNELMKIYKDVDPLEAGSLLSVKCHVLLKGGHNPLDKGRDHLFINKKHYSFKGKVLEGQDKHGTGCVLSSAITANILKGNTLKTACLRAKKYTTKFMLSNKTFLGYHKL